LNTFSIKDLETISGIKAHTLRIWEQRYKIIEPHRTDTNIRLYDDNDLKKILNISFLNQKGYKISKIASMNNASLSEKVLELAQDNIEYPVHVHSLMVSMLELDEEHFEKTISRCVQQFGLENAMIHVIYPFLSKIGLLWQVGSLNPYQEHFILHLIRQKIIVAIDSCPHHFSSNTKRFLLYLPSTEFHEVGLLLAHYILKSRGYRVFYFGQSLPFADLCDACNLCKPDFTFTIITTLGEQDLHTLVENAANCMPNITHIVSGYHLASIKTKKKNVHLSPNIQSFIEFISR
jgi:DNA-binding transcriptional MerR regulator